MKRLTLATTALLLLTLGLSISSKAQIFQEIDTNFSGTTVHFPGNRFA